MSDKPDTRVDTYKRWILDHKILSIMILVGVVVIALGAFSEGAWKIVDGCKRIFETDKESTYRQSGPPATSDDPKITKVRPEDTQATLQDDTINPQDANENSKALYTDQRLDNGKKFVNFVEESGNVVTNSIGMKLVYIPAGLFKMGSPSIEQGRVRISEGFWMGQTEVTQGQYEWVRNAQPWSGETYVQEDANNPAVYVTWEDAAAFCRKLSQQEGRTYRLPTEAEWEYACRAGTTTRFSFGDSDSSLGDHAWFLDNTSKVGQEYAHPVGHKKPNPWGLYDMHGNVWEWCSDWYNEDEETRSLRGGSWWDHEYALGCHIRLGYNHISRLRFIGFRVVRSRRN